MSKKTIYDLLKNSASKWPDKVAVIKGDSRLSYKETEERVILLARSLTAAGIKNGDRVGIFLEKGPEQVVSLFAATRCGAIFVILNNKLKKEQILHIVRDCGIKGIITSEVLYEAMLAGRLENTSIEFAVFADNGRYDTKRILLNKRIPPAAPPADDISCIIYTSGSTGMPKGVVITHGNLIDGAEIVSEYLKCGHDDKVLSILPFSFDYGQNQLLTTFMNGATIVLHNFVFPDDALRIIEREKITALAGIPTIWLSLINAKTVRSYEYKSLRYVTNSGGKIPVEYVKKMVDVFKHTRIYLMYGLTEAFRSTYLLPELVDDKPDSIGTAIPRVKISVLNREGNECAPGEEGELVHRGALMSLGYWGNAEATDARIRMLPAGAAGMSAGEKGVFSGDLVKRDGDGLLYFLGRNDEMMKSSGYRISPTEIEEALYKIEGLSAAVVFGKEDPVLGQKIVAVVNCSNKNETRGTITEHCSLHLPDYAVPHEIIFINDAPKTVSGKLDRSMIKGMYAGH